MSSYNKLKFQQNYEIIGSKFQNIKNIDNVLNELDNTVVNKMKKFLLEYQDEYKIRKINKNTFIMHSANLSNFEKSLDKLNDDELNLDNRDLFELNIKDPAKRREGSTSFTYNNNNYYLTKNKKSLEMSFVSVYTGIRDEYLGRMLMFRNLDDLHVIDIVDYSIDLDQVQQNYGITYNKRILFNILIFNYFLSDLSNIYLNYDPGLQYLQRVIYYIFELYNKKRNNSDPKLDGMLLLDGSIDPLMWKNNEELYFVPGIELLLFKPEQDLVLESLYYIRDNIMFYDIDTWRNYLKQLLDQFKKNKKDQLRYFNLNEFSKLNIIINNYATKCRNIYKLNDMYNPVDKLKGKTFKMDTECSCMIVKNLSDYNKNKDIQTNKQPLLSDMISEIKNQEFDINKQNKAFVVQEVCMKDMSEDYMVPTKPTQVIRFMTYNVHYWQGPRDKKNYTASGIKREHKYNGSEMVDVIAALNPDIVALQEVINTNIDNNWAYINWDDIKNKLSLYGYTITNNNNLNFCAADTEIFGNMLIHKNTVILTNLSTIVYNQQGVKPNDNGKRRCMIKAETTINGNKYSVCCIHLDDKSSKGRNEFIDLVAEDFKKDQNIKILMGDFNSYRTDYPFQKLNSINMDDCYNLKNLAPPKYTTWTGSEIDFIIVDKKIKKENILGCFVGHTPVSDHLPIIMDIRMDNTTKYDGSFIRLPYDNYENSINTEYMYDLNSVPSSDNWFKYITKNLLNDKLIPKEYIELPTEDMISKSTLIDKIPINNLIKDKNILSKANIVKHISRTKLNIINYVQTKPLFVNNNGVNIADNMIYELVSINNTETEPIPATWVYEDDYNIRTNLQKGGGYLYPANTWKINNSLLTEMSDKLSFNNKFILTKLYEKDYDLFMRFELLNEDSKWISLHSLCYYHYAKKNNLTLKMDQNFDKQFKVKMGLYPLTNEIDVGTIPVNTTSDTLVWIHPINNQTALSPGDQQSFIFKKLNQADIYVSVVDSIKVDNTEILTKPLMTIHIINFITQNETFENIFVKYLDNYIKNNQPQNGGYYEKYMKYKKKYDSLR